MYVFAIALNSLLGDEDEVSAYYSSVGTSMVTLFLSGVLLDNISDLVNTMIDLRAVVALAAFALFLLLSAVTVMNMVRDVDTTASDVVVVPGCDCKSNWKNKQR